ncbi:SdrD B-like domain-containing protein [Actinokineospora cianjurensis]|uniref:SdrD B-like protein n=1 Tax=Actinokineospora cianjurensis TaxID=585224 RepID=A0A421B724_9PSEU|nr:SdrD B-like domain-containing protein [Actinokineospora cianjurensis]RLK60020.1 SdrD B-like protein [Actinokineospora cianjurensis]
MSALTLTATLAGTAHAEEIEAAGTATETTSASTPEAAPTSAEPAPQAPAEPAVEPAKADEPAEVAAEPATAAKPVEVAEPTGPADPTDSVEVTAPGLPAPPQQAENGAQAPAAAQLSISATVAAGPFLVGQQIPVTVTIANPGDADATGVKADSRSVSGSSFSIGSDQWGELGWNGTGVTVPAGQSLVRTVQGVVYSWNAAAPVIQLIAYDNAALYVAYTLSIPLKAPNAASGTVAGRAYADRNDNGSFDAGEGLAGVQVSLGGGLPETPITTSDAQGRFRFTGLPLAAYTLNAASSPDGWTIENRYRELLVDGTDSTSNIELRGVRPLSDRFEATMEFTEDVYNVGDHAEIRVTLTNKGSADLTGIVTGCDRSGGEGPELRDVDLGPLAWPNTVAVPAGQSRTYTITGSISAETGEYGVVIYGCDFGPGDDPEGFPSPAAVARVSAPPADLSASFFHDRDDDWTIDDGELLAGVAIGVYDGFTGAFVTKVRTDANGKIVVRNLPAGLYGLKPFGPWRPDEYHDDMIFTFVGTCQHCGDTTVRLLPGPVVPEDGNTDVDPIRPGTNLPPVVTPVTNPVPQARAAITTSTTSTDLADTGANVLGLTAIGTLAVLAGFATTLTARRRRKA